MFATVRIWLKHILSANVKMAGVASGHLAGGLGCSHHGWAVWPITGGCGGVSRGEQASRGATVVLRGGRTKEQAGRCAF